MWSYVGDNAEKLIATQAAEYVVALLNIGLMFDPLTGNRIPVFNQFTQFQRLMSASKHTPSVLYGEQPRYFLIVEVTQESDPFPFLIETYQDSLGNWLPVIPSSAKNFLPQPASYEESIPITELLWLTVKASEPAIVSARAAAKFLMENNYFPSLYPNSNMVDERLVHAEMREVSPSSVAVTARNRKVWDEEKLEKLENEIDQLGSLLAERLLEKQALLRSLQDRLLAEGIREGLESRAAHYDSLESVEERLGRIEVVVKKLEGQLEEKEATRSKLKLNIKNDRDKETFQIEGLQTDLRSTSTTSRTYVYIVVDYLPQDLLTVIDENIKGANRQRRQFLMVSDTWRTSGISGWTLQTHFPFSWDYQSLSNLLDSTFIVT